ncbi:transglutaminase family protein [Chryseobacterium sp. Marseille-Q3244]|uniref:transglutaminase family protein n=1 Tax=Chryseobacterium sp. Marseille-Q3244 TaxID=2758092 RepID=UPI002024528B|nr:transglutaminase family protein [Chryseobacterium sp. Marseille-Q3244]
MRQIILLYYFIVGCYCYGQRLPKLPETPQQANLNSVPVIRNETSNLSSRMNNYPNYVNPQKKVNYQSDQEHLNKEVERQMAEIRAEAFSRNFKLSPLSDKKGTSAYYNAFEHLSKLDSESYSIADAVFIVENAYNNNDRNFQVTYQGQIQKATNIIRKEIKNSRIEDSDNVSKNLSIFKYFAEDSKLNGKVVHKAMKYDFDDYMGAKDYSKMFVSKLMKTNTGQCHSMPLLYLILAEQIGAEAYLVMSPNHSYIRFKDADGEMLSVELTNGMFSANSFVLNSGYIKAEALKNKLYMQNLSKQEILSQTYVDLASGYIHKYGYDEFVSKVLDKALALNPNNINATLWKSNTDQMRFMQACARFGIDPENKDQLQNIRNYPPLEEQFLQIKSDFDYIDQSGFTQMPLDQYEKWLGSLRSTENKQKSDEIAERIKIINAQKLRKAKERPKPVPPKKEKPKDYRILRELLTINQKQINYEKDFIFSCVVPAKLFPSAGKSQEKG